MRHKKSGKKFNRDSGQRKALFRSLIQSFILNEEIKTTESKAKSLTRLIDKLIAKAKIGSFNVRRQILAFLPNRKSVNKLVDDIAPRFKDKKSGFTRFIRLGNRRGDNSMLVKMELLAKKEKPKTEVGKQKTEDGKLKTEKKK